MNNIVKRATVGRVSPRGVTRKAPDVDATGCAEAVGLRCANPTYEVEELRGSLPSIEEIERELRLDDGGDGLVKAGRAGV